MSEGINWEPALIAMADQWMRTEPVTLPPGLVAFEAGTSATVDMTLKDGPMRQVGPLRIVLTATLADGSKVTSVRSLEP
ncbi:hypothetical protein ABT061_29160 [Streptosporangium sp. NPDC002544]|uniref:hypothetical protein n=1 Tax=Streptosporangium sp. NPDC002544 TaxID=3154538 RepID=UPI00332FD6A3